MDGISGFLSLLALLGFVLFVVGIGLAVVASSQGRAVRGGAVLAVLGLAFGIVLTVIGQGIIVVPPQEVAVIWNTITGEFGDERGPGTHIIVPLMQTAQNYSISVSTYTQDENEGGGPVRARTVDGQEVLIEVSVQYRIIEEQASEIHRNWQNRYLSDLIAPVLRGFVRDVVSAYRAEAVYSTQREEIQQDIEARMSERLLSEGIHLVDLIISDVSFSNEDFARSIEQVQIAERQAQEASQAADRARIQAQGERDAEILRAEGEGQAIILRAQAQAEALRLVSEQIAANPNLIQYEYIQQLADNINVALIPSNSPFLFDLNSLGVGDPDFRAPEVPQSLVPTVDPTPDAADD